MGEADKCYACWCSVCDTLKYQFMLNLKSLCFPVTSVLAGYLKCHSLFYSPIIPPHSNCSGNFLSLLHFEMLWLHSIWSVDLMGILKKKKSCSRIRQFLNKWGYFALNFGHTGNSWRIISKVRVTWIIQNLQQFRSPNVKLMNFFPPCSLF